MRRTSVSVYRQLFPRSSTHSETISSCESNHRGSLLKHLLGGAHARHDHFTDRGGLILDSHTLVSGVIFLSSCLPSGSRQPLLQHCLSFWNASFASLSGTTHSHVSVQLSFESRLLDATTCLTTTHRQAGVVQSFRAHSLSLARVFQGFNRGFQ